MAMPNKIECIVCKEKIERGALKCIKCSSFQNWRRHFDFSALILSVLTALISVSTTAFTVLHFVVSDRSDPRFSILTFQPDKIEIESYNVGNRAAILKHVNISHIKNGSPDPPVDLSPDDPDPIIPPGAWKKLVLKKRVSGTPVSWTTQIEKDATYRLRFVFDALNHKSDTITLNYP